VTIEVSATGEKFVDGGGVPDTHPTYSGSMSALFSITFPVVFTVDSKAHTVAAGSVASTGGSGTDSFSLTATDQGQPSDTCTVPAHTAFKAVGGLAPVWGGGPDAKSYAAGVMLFSLSAGPDRSKLYPCSASSPTSIINVSVESGFTVPGSNLQYVDIPSSKNPAAPNPGCMSGKPTDIYVPIPISDLGKEEVVTSFHPGPIACRPPFSGRRTPLTLSMRSRSSARALADDAGRPGFADPTAVRRLVRHPRVEPGARALALDRVKRLALSAGQS
jgi:hypothetical protein